MATIPARQQALFTYSTSSGGQTYLYDVCVDPQGLVSVRNIRTTSGPVTTVPAQVLDDMETAKSVILQEIGESSADNGTVVFTGQTSRPVVIAGGVLNNTNYRVVYTTPDGTILQTANKTTTGFDAVAPAAYGTVLLPKTVTYVVLVASHQSSNIGGTVSFVAADAGIRSVTFLAPFTTDAYRVVLSQDGFFGAKVINKTRTGFQIQIGYTLTAIETATVGYDVFA